MRNLGLQALSWSIKETGREMPGCPRPGVPGRSPVGTLLRSEGTDSDHRSRPNPTTRGFLFGVTGARSLLTLTTRRQRGIRRRDLFPSAVQRGKSRALRPPVEDAAGDPLPFCQRHEDRRRRRGHGVGPVSFISLCPSPPDAVRRNWEPFHHIFPSIYT